MEPRKPGSPNMKDFNELSDRVIAEGNKQPTLVIKTNLDPENATEENPYLENKLPDDPKEFEDYFKE
ncbi:MAG TPA: hypothetical protein VNM69_10235 [Bacillus sp. (in: firmicutes)]|uniref:hypothetical protein n=1 Tax=Bacillus litorisediminis TaxID=2922713 RepID=UPI001FAE63DE|nr:hypothetical protein [Bacillus litorisediminis]HWO76257.1 hypothetical protein [Bacillus sp. (in: firmicutes)]